MKNVECMYIPTVADSVILKAISYSLTRFLSCVNSSLGRILHVHQLLGYQVGMQLASKPRSAIEGRDQISNSGALSYQVAASKDLGYRTTSKTDGVSYLILYQVHLQ